MKMGQLPPSPCKVCSSNNHWDKECPDWLFYKAKQQKTAYQIKTDKEDDLEGYYSSVYSRGWQNVDPIYRVEGWGSAGGPNFFL